MSQQHEPSAEEKVSALIDGELDPSEIAGVEELIAGNSSLKELKSDIKDSGKIFAVYKNEEVEEPDWNHMWEGISSEIGIGETSKDGMNSMELMKLIIESQKSTPSFFERLFAGFVPAIVGAACALAMVFFVASPFSAKNQNTNNSSNKIVTSPDNTTNNLVVSKNKLNVPPVNRVSTNITVKPKTVPNTDVENILNENDSCIIESMSSEDDIVTTVFKVADDDGSMITVIWLPVEDSGTSI
jgi:hypothetical protein